jgi:DNA-binding response OmpR family regulator
MAQDRILVVEDEPTVAEIVDRYLRREGYEVSLAHNGLRALEEFDRFQPDLIVLDLMLPGLDGIRGGSFAAATSENGLGSRIQI